MLEPGLFLAWTVCVIGVSSVLHEYGHAWAARAVGWEVVGLRWHWYGLSILTDTNGRSDQLWKVAVGGPCVSAALAFGCLAATALPEPAPLIFRVGFFFNAIFLITQLAPIRPLDGAKVLAGLRRSP